MANNNSTNDGQSDEKSVFFSDLSDDNGFTEMASLCMNCHEQGVTRLLLTKIPFFKVIELIE